MDSEALAVGGAIGLGTLVSAVLTTMIVMSCMGCMCLWVLHKYQKPLVTSYKSKKGYLNKV
jgi:uncharacterized membrane protein YczE